MNSQVTADEILLKSGDVGSLDELTKRVHAFRKDGYWIFRGVKDHTYDLKPKIGRPNARKSISDGNNLPYSRQEEKLLFDNFVRAAGPYVTHRPESDLEWLSLAQHHGMFTRLLDWSESLLVAAFFAVEEARRKFAYVRDENASNEHRDLYRPEKRFPTIFAIKNFPVVPARSKADLDSLDNVMMYHPPHLSPRIPAQRSVFTVHKFPNQEFQPAELVRLRITGNPLTMKLDLNACGINTASLFPDIDGLAEYKSWSYKWGVLPPDA